MSEQEKLIEQRKQEIQRKLAQKQKATPKPSAPPASSLKINLKYQQTKPAAAAGTSKKTEPEKTQKLAEPLDNKFSNDGSFMAQFMKLQQKPGGKLSTRPPSSSPTPDEEASAAASPPDPEPSESTSYASSNPSYTGKSSTYNASHSSSPATSHTPKPYVALKPRLKAFRESSDSDDDEEQTHISPPEDSDIRDAIDRLAHNVAEGGMIVEETVRATQKNEPRYRFLQETEGNDYKYYKKKLAEYRVAKKHRLTQERIHAAAAKTTLGTPAGSSMDASRKRKSRWGGEDLRGDVPPPKVMTSLLDFDNTGGGGPSTSVSELKNVNPVGMRGTTELSQAQMKQLKEQQEMNRMYDAIVNFNKKVKKENDGPVQEKKKKHKYEYDSDEDTQGGTWEHKQRMMEMKETADHADMLTNMGRDKHFLGDYLPPEELEKFLETLEALKDGRTPDYSDYKKFKIQADNIGYQMLMKMGWEEGSGLGKEHQGITTPVNRGAQKGDNTGLGTDRPDGLTDADAQDEFQAFRKRMMLAYRFRPNPLNNPRRPYY